MAESHGEEKTAGKVGKPITLLLEFPDNALAATLFGEFDNHLKLIEAHLGVEIHPRGNTLAIGGRKVAARQAQTLLSDLYGLLERGGMVDTQRVEDGLRTLEEPHRNGVGGSAGTGGMRAERVLAGEEGGDLALHTPGRVIHPRTAQQAVYLRTIMEKEVTLGVGPAGTGKTYLAVAMAVRAFMEGRVARIVLTRPAVEAGERLGFLPGDLQAKVNPYLRPLYDALYDTLGFDKVERMMMQGALEIAPLAYMRGRTLAEAFIILDEAQNTTPEQMKMFLTRFGTGAKVAAVGDVTQVDLPRGQPSGLVQALEILEGVDGIGVVRFTERDVVRHPLVRRIVQAYERAQEGKKPPPDGRG